MNKVVQMNKVVSLNDTIKMKSYKCELQHLESMLDLCRKTRDQLKIIKRNISNRVIEQSIFNYNYDYMRADETLCYTMNYLALKKKDILYNISEIDENAKRINK